MMTPRRVRHHLTPTATARRPASRAVIAVMSRALVTMASTSRAPRRHKPSNWLGGLECGDFGLSEMDLSGHHSNPPAPLEALLDDAVYCARAGLPEPESGRTCAPGALRESARAAHPRQGRILDAISQVLSRDGKPMQTREVHVQVEALLGEPVRRATVKATLAGNLDGPTPRFVRVARGRYGLAPHLSQDSTDVGSSRSLVGRRGSLQSSRPTDVS